MLHYLREVGYSLFSIFKGMKVTYNQAYRRDRSTVLYPDVRPDLAPRFRGLPEVDMDICIVCHLCEKACPTQCIYIEDLKEPAVEGEPAPKADKDKKKEARVFDINAALCMYCGLCEEACPTKPVKSIILKHSFEVAQYDRQSLVYGIEGPSVLPPENPPPAKAEKER
jgi:formate hydrogenlyase subunit 6/NADH:ubiquinone oxidoreductase subunit I